MADVYSGTATCASCPLPIYSFDEEFRFRSLNNFCFDVYEENTPFRCFSCMIDVSYPRDPTNVMLFTDMLAQFIEIDEYMSSEEYQNKRRIDIYKYLDELYTSNHSTRRAVSN